MDFHALLKKIVNKDKMHAQWLNTLSFMENAGARKISACEHPTEVSLIQLKHAAEEHRHAYYLKKQILKTGTSSCTGYRDNELLAPIATRHYLHTLDIQACRYLRQHFRLTKENLRFAAYLFVTYAIEVRADELYPVYQEVLTSASSKIMVKSIILEEEGHLEEMIIQLEKFSEDWKLHAHAVCEMENRLYEHWIRSVMEEVMIPDHAG